MYVEHSVNDEQYVHVSTRVHSAESAGVHENARRYIAGRRAAPLEVARSMRDWFRPHNCDLAGLLLRRISNRLMDEKVLARPSGAEVQAYSRGITKEELGALLEAAPALDRPPSRVGLLRDAP